MVNLKRSFRANLWVAICDAVSVNVMCILVECKAWSGSELQGRETESKTWTVVLTDLIPWNNQQTSCWGRADNPKNSKGWLPNTNYIYFAGSLKLVSLITEMAQSNANIFIKDGAKNYGDKAKLCTRAWACQTIILNVIKGSGQLRKLISKQNNGRVELCVEAIVEIQNKEEKDYGWHLDIPGRIPFLSHITPIDLTILQICGTTFMYSQGMGV